MFTIDTGITGNGSLGPWVSWTSEGSARKGLPPECWVLREKAEGAETATTSRVPAFENGCVMDLDTLKLGWEKDGGKGAAPERRWNPSVSQATPRPSEERKPSGAHVWAQAVSVRVAIGGGKAATWEQASFGAYQAFARLAQQIVAEWPEKSNNGAKLPLVKQVGTERLNLKSGNSSIPVLQVVDWVSRPACLAADAPVIAAAPASQPAPAPQPVQQAPVPADLRFG